MFLKDIGKDKRKLENTGKYCRLLQKQSQGICPPRWMLPGRWLPLLSWRSEGCFSPPDSGLGHLLVFANRVTEDMMQAKAWKALALDGGEGVLLLPWQERLCDWAEFRPYRWDHGLTLASWLHKVQPPICGRGHLRPPASAGFSRPQEPPTEAVGMCHFKAPRLGWLAVQQHWIIQRSSPRL